MPFGIVVENAGIRVSGESLTKNMSELFYLCINLMCYSNFHCLV